MENEKRRILEIPHQTITYPVSEIDKVVELLHDLSVAFSLYEGEYTDAQIDQMVANSDPSGLQ